MKCDEVRQKLPEYIAGVCTEEERNHIAEHIAECAACSKYLKNLDEPVLGQDGGNDIGNDRVKKLMKKIRWKLIIQISAAVIGIMIVCFYTIPLLYYSMSGITNPVLRASMDMVQFSQPNAAGGYSTGGGRIFGWDMSFFTSKTVGSEVTVGTEYKNTYYFGGSVGCPGIGSKNGMTALGIGTAFIHPKFTYTVKKPVEDKLRDLEKLENADVTVDISLNRTVTLEGIVEVLKSNPGVKVLWMAVESGEEKQMQLRGTYYYVQWGIPGSFIDINAFPNNPGTEFTPGTFEKYKDRLNREMEWLNENKYRVKHDEDLYKYEHIDNSIGSKAEYILKNGYNIYGMRLTGKSNDVIKMGKELDIREISMHGMKFTEW